VALLEAGTLLATATHGDGIAVWDAKETAVPVKRATLPGVVSVDFVSDRGDVCAIARSGTLWFVDRDDSMPREFDVETGELFLVRCIDENVLVCVGRNELVTASFTRDEGTRLVVAVDFVHHQAPIAPVRLAALCRTSRLVALVAEDGRIAVQRVGEARPVHLRDARDNVASACFACAGELLAVGTTTGEVEVLRTNGFEQKACVARRRSAIVGLAAIGMETEVLLAVDGSGAMMAVSTDCDVYWEHAGVAVGCKLLRASRDGRLAVAGSSAIAVYDGSASSRCSHTSREQE
jgi:hypothetical protein